MKVYVNYNDSRWRKYKIDFDKIANAAAVGVDPDAEVSIVLTNDDEIHKLNREYRKIDRATNVLSFELDDDILLGDIYISLDTVMSEAASEHISVADHTAHMVVHGVLHLMGYDHIRVRDAKKMESREVEILKSLNIKNPYVPESAVCADLSCCPGGRFLSWWRRIARPGGVWQYVVMAVLGGLAALGFAPFHLWWVTVLAVICAYGISLRRSSRPGVCAAFLRIFPFSAAYALAMFWWVTHSIYVVPELTAQFAIWTVPALLGIALAGGIIFAVPFVVVMRMRTCAACRPFVFATTWTLVLWLREWLFTGFPWNPVANIVIQMPGLANSMSLWGALGLTFIIVGLCAAVMEVMRNRKSGLAWIVFGIFVLLMLIGAVWGVKNIQYAQRGDNVSPIIRVVQPARAQNQKMAYTRADAIRNATENVRALTALAAVPGNHDLVVFPETSYPFTIVDGDNMPLGPALDKDVIVGAMHYADGRMYNSMVVASADGDIKKIYNKSHLVPFGEYAPLGGLLPSPGQLSRGGGADVINMNIGERTFSFAPAICYEIIFSDSLVLDGQMPDAVINITNDTWFGNTPGTYQHLDMVRRYAIESGLPIVRANYSGISAFVSADGIVLSQIPVGRPGYMDGIVWGAHMTPYRAIGRDGTMAIILLFACICTISLYAYARRE